MPMSGRELCRSIASVAFVSPASKCVSTVDARWPPADEPMMPTRCGSILYSVRVRPHPAHRARHVLKFRRIMIAVRAEPVFQNETRHAMLVQPERVIVAFVRRQTARNRRRDKSPSPRRVGSCVVASGRYGVIVGISLRICAQRAGRAVRPEWNGQSAFQRGKERATRIGLQR